MAWHFLRGGILVLLYASAVPAAREAEVEEPLQQLGSQLDQ